MSPPLRELLDRRAVLDASPGQFMYHLLYVNMVFARFGIGCALWLFWFLGFILWHLVPLAMPDRLQLFAGPVHNVTQERA